MVAASATTSVLLMMGLPPRSVAATNTMPGRPNVANAWTSCRRYPTFGTNFLKSSLFTEQANHCLSVPCAATSCSYLVVLAAANVLYSNTTCTPPREERSGATAG